jgi:hypothetical protein
MLALIGLLRQKGATQLIVEPGGYNSDPARLAKFYGRLGFIPMKEESGAMVLMIHADDNQSGSSGAALS